MKDRTTNKVVCGDDGAMHVLTKKRIIRGGNGGFVGWEYDDADGNWKPMLVSATIEEIEDWCAEENLKYDNIFRIPRDIEEERINHFVSYVDLFLRDPDGLTIDNMKAGMPNPCITVDEFIQIMTEIYEATHKSTGIALQKMALIKAEMEARNEQA